MFPWRGRGGWGGGGGGGPNWGGGGGGQNQFGNFGPNNGQGMPFGGFGPGAGRGMPPFHQNRFAPPGNFRGGRGGFRGRGRGSFDGDKSKVLKQEPTVIPKTEPAPSTVTSTDQAQVEPLIKQKETTPDGQTVKNCQLCDTKVVGEENYQLHLNSDAHKSKAASTPVAGPSGVKAGQTEAPSEASVTVQDVKAPTNVVKVERAAALACEDEPEYDDSLVLLDWYNSDLNLKIDTGDFCSARAMSGCSEVRLHGFGYMWAGVRATLGATKGKVCFEVRVDSNQNTAHLTEEQTPNVMRVGWSTDASDLQLGEDMFSYGYGGTAKLSVNSKFKDYGIRYGVGDVVGCYLDWSGLCVIMKFTVNGRDQGIAFRISKQELKGQALYPHVLTKNQDFTVNFGQMPAPMQPLLQNFTPIGQLDVDDGLVRGQGAPPSRDACETLMMIGLPGAGKTYWAENWSKKHPEKRYNIMGTNNLIERMKVMGLSRKKNYHGRWDALIKKCTDCFEEMLKMAARRRRNYILDQTNVFPTARPRKLKPFNGFKIKAVVVIPDDEEFRRRIVERNTVEGKEVPEAAVLNMKANFVLPETEEEFFSDVLYVEQSPEVAEKTINNYVEEAVQAGFSATAGVRTFKNRCAMKRQKNRLPIPGRLLINETPVVMKVEPKVEAKVEPKVEGKVEPKVEPVQFKEEAASGSGDKTAEDKAKAGNSRDSNSSREKKRSRSRSRERKRGGDAKRSATSRDGRRSRSRSRDRRRNRSRDRRDNSKKENSDSQDRRERRRSRSRERRTEKQGKTIQDGPAISPWLGGNSPFRVKTEEENKEAEDNMGPGGPIRGNLGPGVRSMGPGLMGPNRDTGAQMGSNMGPGGNTGPRGLMENNMGPGGPMRDSMGPRGQMGRNMGPGGPMRDNMGPRGLMENNMGPGGPMRDNVGPRGLMENNMGPGGPMRDNVGPGGQMGRNMGPGGPVRDNMGPVGPMRDNMGPGGQMESNMNPRGPMQENMGPGGPMRDNMGPGGQMGRSVGPGGPRSDNMGPGGSMGGNMGPGGPMGGNMGPGGSMGGNMGPGGPMGGNMGPGGYMGPGGSIGPGGPMGRNMGPGESNDGNYGSNTGGGNYMGRGGAMMGRGGGNMGRGTAMGQPGFGSMAPDNPFKQEGGIRKATGLLGEGPGTSRGGGDPPGGRGGLLGQPPNSGIKPLMQNKDSYKQEDMDLEKSAERDVGPSGFGDQDRFGGSNNRFNQNNDQNSFISEPYKRNDKNPFMDGPNQRNNPNSFMGGPNQGNDKNPFQRNNPNPFMGGPNQGNDQNQFQGGPNQDQNQGNDQNPFLGGRNNPNPFMGRPNQGNDQNPFMGGPERSLSDSRRSQDHRRGLEDKWGADSSGFDNEPLEPVDDEDNNYDKSALEGRRDDNNMRRNYGENGGNPGRGGYGGNRNVQGNNMMRNDQEHMRGPTGRFNNDGPAGFNENQGRDFHENRDNFNENRGDGFNENRGSDFNERGDGGFNENRRDGFSGNRGGGSNENRHGFNENDGENFNINRSNNEEMPRQHGNDGPSAGRFAEPSGPNTGREGFESNRNMGFDGNGNRGNSRGRMDNHERGIMDDGGRRSAHSHHSQGEGRGLEEGGRGISLQGRMHSNFEEQDRVNQRFGPNDNMMGQQDGPQGRNAMGRQDDNMRYENGGPDGRNPRERNQMGQRDGMGDQMMGPGPNMNCGDRGNDMIGQRREMMDQNNMFQRRDALDHQAKEMESRGLGGRPGPLRAGSPGRSQDGFGGQGGHASQSDIGNIGQRREGGRDRARDGTQSDLGPNGRKSHERHRDERHRDDRNKDRTRDRGEDRRDRDDRRERDEKRDKDDKRDDRRDREDGRNRDAGRRDAGRRDRDDRGRDQDRDRDRGRGRDKPDELVDKRSAGDRRLERDMAKGQFDNGIRLSNPMAARFLPQPPASRLNVESSTIPGMNPPAPDPSPSSSGAPPGYPPGAPPGYPPGAPGAPGYPPGAPGYPPGEHGTPGYPPEKAEGQSGPDYAALLQYLQYYQKQMAPEDAEQK